jgi:hypothetical protein
MFTCQRCNYNTKYKNCLIQHLNNKNPCKILNLDISRDILLDTICEKKHNDITFDCEFCSRKFNNSTNMYRHKKICKKKPEKIDNISFRLNQLEVKNTKLEEQNNKLQLELLAIKEKSTSIINNINNTQNITNINLKLNDFGKENMDAIPESLIGTLFIDLRFRELLANLHCDPNYPENQNVRIKSIKRNTMEIFRNNKWDIMTFTNGLTELLLQGHKIFKDYYKKDKDRILEEDMSESEINEVLNQLDQIEKLSKDELKPLLIDLQMMLEEYRENGHAILY